MKMDRTRLILSAVCLVLPIIAEAAITSEDALSNTHTKAEQHFEKANELFKRMEYEGAIAEYEKVVTLSSNSEITQNAQYWIGQSHFRAGQFDAAQATFAKLIETHPTSAIVPVTKLMVDRVEQAKKIEEEKRAMNNAEDKGFIIDPDTGVKYTKIATFRGKDDVIELTNQLNLSPNGKFLLSECDVVPLDDNEAFELDDGHATRASWSPDGRKIAFYSRGAICMVPVSPETGRPTGPVRKLLDSGYKWQTRVSWSPDSEKLVFIRMPDEEKGICGGDIWTVSVKDGSLRQITRDDAREEAPVWSPDGKTIAYVKRKGRHFNLWLVSAEDGEPRKIIDAGGRLFRIFPYWSPNGKWILYNLGRKLYLFDIYNNRELEITSAVRAVGDFFSFSPDGKKILFYRTSYDYIDGLKVVSASGGLPLDVAGHIQCYGTAVWASDSKTIAVQGGDEKGNIVIWIMPLSDDNPVPVKMNVEVDGRPFPFSVSPGAKKIAFVVKRDDETEDLFVVPISLQTAATAGPAVKVFDKWYRGGAFNVRTSWSPDGNKLLVIHGQGRQNVWIASSKGDKPVQITKTPEGGIWPGWSPDGTKINYIAGGDFYIRAVSGSKATKIAGADRRSTWSPDSKKIAFVSNGSISIVPVDGTENRQIARLKDLGLVDVFDICWSPDGKSIACVGRHVEKGAADPIYVIPVEGGDVSTLVTDDDSGKYELTWSPDGKWIAYNSARTTKLRPESTMWEADFEEILAKASQAD
jgi:Tol biopolymer transport system component